MTCLIAQYLKVRERSKTRARSYELIEDADHFEISGMQPKNGKHDAREAPCSLGG